MSRRVVPHKPTIHEQLRMEQVNNALLVLMSLLPLVIGSKIASKKPFDQESLVATYIGILAVEYLMVLISVMLVLSLRRLKYGAGEDDGLLLVFIAVTTLLVTVLLAKVMILGLPLAILIMGVYNITIAERKIRDLKLTLDETDMST